MSTSATFLLARRSMRARIGRLIAIAVAIVLGVAFVVGSFVLADTLRSGFDTLFSSAFENTDLQVRTELAFGDVNDAQAARDPVPAELVDTVAAVPGVADADGSVQRSAQIVDSDGEVVTTGGAPMFGASWDGSDEDNTIEIREGAAPTGADQMAVDKNTADNNDLEVGDEVGVVTSTGRHTFTLTGTVGLENSDGFGGATFALWDPATAAEVLGAEGVVDSIEIRVADGEDVATVQQRVAEVLPDNVEVIDQEALIDESNSSVNEFIGPIGTGLLIFACITAFVSAFLINNVFAITIGQRLRELALLRAVGGAGGQVRRLIVVEALVISVIATIIGVFAGIGVAKLIVAIFNAAGAGFPDFGIVLKPSAVVIAFIVGVGVTVLAVLVPARRAARIPPVAAMRPELGFEALSSKRLVVGTVTMIVGGVMFVVGLLVKPGGTTGLIALAGGGALLLFIGTASVSATVAKPVTKALGWPVARVYKAAGQLASENAGRAPAPDLGDGGSVDDRCRPRQRRIGVRRLAARHVHGGHGPRRHRRLGHHGRELRPVARRDRRHARRGPRTVGGVGRAHRAGHHRRRREADRRRRRGSPRGARQRRTRIRRLAGATGRRVVHPHRPGRRPRGRGRLDGSS